MAKRWIEGRGRAYEDKLAREGRGKRVLYSGAGMADKNDLNGKFEKIEAKSTGAKTYTLKKSDLKNLARNASIIGKVGVMYLDFSGDEYVIMRRKDFETYVCFDSCDGDAGDTPLHTTTFIMGGSA